MVAVPGGSGALPVNAVEECLEVIALSAVLRVEESDLP